MTKTRQDNDVTDNKEVLYTENKTELLCLIGLDAIYDEKQII